MSASLWRAALSYRHLIGQRQADLGLVELQLVISDPPGFLGLQPLCCLLLRVVLLQPEGLDQLPKRQLTARGQSEFGLLSTKRMLRHGSERSLGRSLLVFLRFGVDVSKDDDVGKVDPEAAEQRGHPGTKNKGRVQQKGPACSQDRPSSAKTITGHSTHARRS